MIKSGYICTLAVWLGNWDSEILASNSNQDASPFCNILHKKNQKERWNVAALGHVAANRSELTGIWRSCCRTPLHEMAHGKGCLAGALLDSFLPLMYTWKRKTLQNHVTDSLARVESRVSSSTRMTLWFQSVLVEHWSHESKRTQEDQHK